MATSLSNVESELKNDEETDSEVVTGTYSGVIKTEDLSVSCGTKSVLSPHTELETEEAFQHRDSAILPLLSLVMDYLHSCNNLQCRLSPQQYLSEHRRREIPDLNLWGAIGSTTSGTTDSTAPANELFMISEERSLRDSSVGKSATTQEESSKILDSPGNAQATTQEETNKIQNSPVEPSALTAAQEEISKIQDSPVQPSTLEKQFSGPECQERIAQLRADIGQFFGCT